MIQVINYRPVGRTSGGAGQRYAGIVGVDCDKTAVAAYSRSQTYQVTVPVPVWPTQGRLAVQQYSMPAFIVHPTTIYIIIN